MRVEINQTGGFNISTGFIKKLFASIAELMPKLADKEISLAFVNDPDIKRLNRTYRKVNKVTDVLAFAERDSGFRSAPSRYFGEIVISYPRAQVQARQHKHSIKQELTLLLAHGFLHLAGFDHTRPNDSKKMRKWEQRIIMEFEKK